MKQYRSAVIQAINKLHETVTNWSVPVFSAGKTVLILYWIKIASKQRVHGPAFSIDYHFTFRFNFNPLRSTAFLTAFLIG